MHKLSLLSAARLTAGLSKLSALILIPVLSLATVSCGGSGGVQSSTVAPASTAVTLDAYPLTQSGPLPGASQAARDAALALSQGINFGNMLEAPREGDWGLRVEDEFIALIGKNSNGTSGFTNSVRLPVRWSNHASTDAMATIDPAFFARVDSVVQRLLARGVTVMMDMHHYRQLDGDALDPNETAVPEAVVKLRFLAMWKQIAEHYASYDSRLLFEIYNEPHGKLDADWNDLLSRAFRVIRQSNPQRAVVIGPVKWNSATELPRLALPPDANILLTVHNYEPFDFTHQGADWIVPAMPVGVDCCTTAQSDRIKAPLDIAVTEAKRLGYPVVVGEFGAYSKATNAARLSYLSLSRQIMKDRSLPWVYWELASGFGIYDPLTHQFRADLKAALYGP